MKKEILGIFVCTLLIAATALPVAGMMNINKTNIKMSNTPSNCFPHSIGLLPTDDSWVDNGGPNTNHGSDVDLMVTNYQITAKTPFLQNGDLH